MINKMDQFERPSIKDELNISKKRIEILLIKIDKLNKDIKDLKNKKD